jgi:uncharacterized protein with NRDE domain
MPMCLLALFYRVVPEVPVIAGANREEEYARGGELPQILDGPIPAVGGVDPRAGGTWFGVNANGVLIAVTNRLRSNLPVSPRSRGLLARELLTLPSARKAADLATRELDSNRYAGCNFVCADAQHAFVLHHGDWLRVRQLPPGIHVLANRDVNDDSDSRVVYALHRLHERRYAGADHCLLALRELCGRNEPGQPPMVLRLDGRGTVSSSVVALRQALADSTYLHAQGPPDRTPYADFSHLFGELSGGA